MDVHISYTQFRLDNGLNVLVHRDPSIPTVAVNMWYHVGSKNERPGRTGFAHLFEHIMFEGSAHVPEGQFDVLLEAAGGENNGSTNGDRTNYWENVPPGALELALWLEADRMGWLLDTMDRGKLDTQRDVVMNERRQGFENRPYGLAMETLLAAMYPPDHPYHWPVIGSMADLEAATLDDVSAFFRTYYQPGNASLAIAGDVSVRRARELVERYFRDIPAGPPIPEVRIPDPTLASSGWGVLEDDVTLPRLYVAWHAPALYADGDAELEVLGSVLSRGKSSRLHRRLVYEEQIAQSVSAGTRSGEAGGLFVVQVTARPDVSLDLIQDVMLEELERIWTEGPDAEEVQRAVAGVETDFVGGLERVGGFGGRADRLNEYYFLAGNPGYVRQDLARYRSLDAERVRAWAARALGERERYALSVVPRGRRDLAATEGP